MTKSIKVAAVQDAPFFLDKEATIKKTCELINKAAKEGAELVLFPEAFISAYPDWVWTVPPSQKPTMNSLFRALYDSAISIDDEAIQSLGKAAKEAGIYVVVGANEKNSESSNATLFNSMIYIDKNGELMGIHRKLIPTGGERLMWGQGDGSTLYSFDSDLGKIGGLLCWENFMPLARQVMYSSGVQIYLAPTWDSSEQWQTAMRHIAREGGMFVISCCQAIHKDEIPDEYDFKKLYANDREWINKGNSCIVDPKGQFLAGPLNAEQGIIYAELNMDEIPDQKWLFDVAGHYSRPDVFEFRVKS